MWPVTLSLAGARFAVGGTAMFSLLALAGDLGCALGPWVTGVVSDVVQNRFAVSEALGLKAGLAVATVFPLLLFFLLLFVKKVYRPQPEVS